jgi:hypothetical protein
MAAEHGHTRCVKILLEKGALVNERCPDTSHNCLMKAIENEHRYNKTEQFPLAIIFKILLSLIIRDTVLEILTHNFSALRYSNGTTTPMRMLIKHMPGVIICS